MRSERASLIPVAEDIPYSPANIVEPLSSDIPRLFAYALHATLNTQILISLEPVSFARSSGRHARA